MGRMLLALAALGMPLQGITAMPAGGPEIVICTSDGPRMVRLDEQGRPVAPGPSDKAGGCAHLWCEPRRQRVGGLRRRAKG